jgi:hypothetical protein
MGLDATARRRWVGGVALAAALGMLIGGQTILKGRLKEVGFLVYWLVCFLFTGLAIAIAFLDARAVHHRTRREQRNLFEATLRQIENEARGRRPRQNPKRPGADKS